jgi:hypothetical protein
MFNAAGHYVLVGTHVTKSPEHGRAGVSSAEVVYIPDKGFVGTDHFTLERDFVGDSEAVVVYYNIEMSVTP